MKKIVLALVLFFSFPSVASAQINSTEEVINSFNVNISINKDTSVAIEETINVYFPEEKHGIYRTIPVFYRQGLKTVSLHPKILAITKDGENIAFEKKLEAGNILLKIGDPDKSDKGSHSYKISYIVDSILKRFGDTDEFYWDAIGSNWEQKIESGVVNVHSPFSDITKVDCFAGEVSTTQKYCTSEYVHDNAQFTTTKTLEPGSGLTIVVGLSPNFVYPNNAKRILTLLQDNWGYFLSLIPFIFIIYSWIKRGRDKRFIENEIYASQGKEKVAAFFERKLLPTVYSPIQGLSPAEIGTIVDEKVGIHDVVAEIVELARLGYLTIERIFSKRRLMTDKLDFKLTKKTKSKVKLASYQKYLLNSLEEYMNEDDSVLLSELKTKFYKKLPEFKNKLYDSMQERGFFEGNPEKVRNIWISISVGITILTSVLTIIFVAITANFVPLILLLFFGLITILISTQMPRRTARGYALFRQITGLKYYLGKGKWRNEIYEKHLFLEEMLPIAISLGVVDKLAKQMSDLGVKPPEYTQGFATANFSSSFMTFEKSTASSLVSSPQGSGSGWSGGSGFGGGGSVGGGGGGGGGGSW